MEDLRCHNRPEHQFQSSQYSLKWTFSRRDVRVYCCPSTYDGGRQAAPDDIEQCPLRTRGIFVAYRDTGSNFCLCEFKIEEEDQQDTCELQH